LFSQFYSYIFNICCLIAVCISGMAAVYLWKDYKKNKLRQFKNFSLGFYFIFLAFFLLSFPKIILFESFWVQIDFILVDLSFLVANLFLVPVISVFSEKFTPFWKKVSQFYLSIIPIYTFLNIFFFKEAVPLKIDEILIYWKNGVFWLHSLLWIPLSSGAAALGICFLFGLKKVGEKEAFFKILSVGIGAILIFVAGMLFWYFKFFTPRLAILNISGIIGDLGFLLGSIGVRLFKVPREFWVKKII